MFNSAQKTSIVNVNKVDVNVTISADDIRYGKDLTVSVEVSNGAEGRVTLFIENGNNTSYYKNRVLDFLNM